MNSLKLSIYKGQRAGSSIRRRSSLNHSRAMPFRYNCVEVTFVQLVWKALGRSW